MRQMQVGPLRGSCAAIMVVRPGLVDPGGARAEDAAQGSEIPLEAITVAGTATPRGVVKYKAWLDLSFN